MDEGNLVIRITTDTQLVQACAAIMATSDPWVTLGINYAQCLAAFEGHCKEIYVAEYDGLLAGFVIIQTNGTFKGYIQTIAVQEAFRGRGVGKKLLAFCEKRILEMSPNIFICVSSFNTGAIKLYYEVGFTLVGELPNFVKAGFTELLLRKSVGPMVGYRVNEPIV